MDKYTLDQDVMVVVDWTGSIPTPIKPYMVTYEIYPYIRNQYQHPIDGYYSPSPIFIGQAYIPAGKTSLELHLNEILGSQRWQQNFLVKRLQDGKVANTGDNAPKTTDFWYTKYRIIVADIPEFEGQVYTTTFDSMQWETQDGFWDCGIAGYSHSNDGVQVTKSLSGAYTISNIPFENVTKVVVTYCTNTNAGTGSIELSVGETTQTQAVTRSGGRTKRNLDFIFNGRPSGLVQLLVNCSVNSIYIAGVSIYYNSSGEALPSEYAEKEVEVGLWYNYENKPLTSPQNALPDLDSQSAIITNCLDGHTDYSAKLLPHIPYINTENFGFGVVFMPTRQFIVNEAIISSSRRAISLTTSGLQRDVYVSNYYYLTYPNINYIYRPLSVYYEGTIGEQSDTQLPTLVISTRNHIHQVAVIDLCPAKYYLQWVDRAGGIQCQPFKGKPTYSEDFTKVQIQSGIGYKRNVNLQSSSKWVLNTDWLNQDMYPYYESIFTSPYLLLYDAENDRSYNVLATDKSYTEKTRENQNKMFNLTLNVVANKTQNMYY